MACCRRFEPVLFRGTAWVSLDSYSKVGGGTSADGDFNDNQQLWSALGATNGCGPWTRARLALTAGGVVAGNDNSPNGWLVRLQFHGEPAPRVLPGAASPGG